MDHARGLELCSTRPCAQSFGSTGGSHVIDGAFVNREETHGRPVFAMLAMVARLASGMAVNPGPKNSTNFETTPSALSSSVMRSTMSVAVASLGSSPKTHAYDFGKNHRHCLAKHDGFRLNATDAPSTPSPLIMVGIGAHERVWIDPGTIFHDHGREMFQIHLVDNAHGRWYDSEIVERLLAPFQEPIPLAISFKL